MRRSGVRWAAAMALFASGCLGPLYRVDQAELYRLSRLPPDRRGESVRVVQQFGNRERPRGGPGHVGVGVGVLVVGAPGGGPSHGHSSNPPNPIASKQAGGAAMMVLAAGAAAGLAFSEGSRWDGWVRVHPEQPVHLYGHDGRYLYVPLAALTPDHAAWAEEAIIAEDESPLFQRTERAPLDRTGFTYGVDAGAGGVATAGADAPIGFLGHLQFGGFPWNELGLLGTVGLGWADDADGNALFNTRIALEIHAYPIALGLARPGLFVMAGDLFHDQDTPDGPERGHRFLVGVGALLQLELTTRLALTLRGGVATLGATENTLVVPEVNLGLAVY
jgi:hypothetical protein